MKAKRFSRFLVTVMALCLTIAVVSGTALAAESDASQVEAIDSAEELKAAFQSGGNYILTENITLQDSNNANGVLNAKADIVLDLNGHTITASNAQCVFGTSNSAAVSITLKNGTVLATSNDESNNPNPYFCMVIQRTEGDTFQAENVVFASAAQALVVNKLGGNVILNGCTLTGGVATVVRREAASISGQVEITGLTVDFAVKNIVNGALKGEAYTLTSEVITRQVSTVDELKTAFQQGGNYKLTADISIEDAHTINGILIAKKDINLDLAGHTITASNSQCVFGTNSNTSGVGITLTNGTVTAVKPLEEGTVVYTMIIQRSANDRFTASGVTFECAAPTLVINKVSGAVTLRDCTVTGGAATVVNQENDSACAVTIENITVDSNVKTFIGGGENGDSCNGINRLVNTEAAIIVKSGETVTISGPVNQNVTVQAGGKFFLTAGGAVNTVTVREDGAFTMNGGTAGTISTAGTTEINGGTTDAITVSAGSFTMNGGSVKATGTNGITFANNTAVVGRITDGTVSGSTYGLVVRYATDVDVDVKVSGGTFTGSTPGNAIVCKKENASTVDNSAIITEGYRTVVNEDNSVTVLSVAEVNGTKYDALENALAAAGDGDTVKLLSATTVASTLEIKSGVTLDLNGQTLTVDSLHSYGVIMDSKADEENGTPGLLKVLQEEQFLLEGNDQKGILPIYVDEGYRFFSYQLLALDPVVQDNGVKFRFYLYFANAHAFDCLSNNENSGITIDAKFVIAGNEDNPLVFTFQNKTLNTLAVNVINADYTQKYAPYMILNGVAEDMKITATPIIHSKSSVTEFEGVSTTFSLNAEGTEGD